MGKKQLETEPLPNTEVKEIILYKMRTFYKFYSLNSKSSYSHDRIYKDHDNTYMIGGAICPETPRD